MMSKAFSIAAAAGLLIATTALGHAQSATQRYAPGQRMQQQHSSVAGQPGASGYSPGHQMHRKGRKSGYPGASGYAPGHQPTTTGRGTITTR